MVGVGYNKLTSEQRDKVIEILKDVKENPQSEMELIEKYGFNDLGHALGLITGHDKEGNKLEFFELTEAGNNFLNGRYGQGELNISSINGQLDPLNIAKDYIEKNPIIYTSKKEGRVWWVWNNIEKFWELADETDIFNSLNNITNWSGMVHNSIKSALIESFKMVGRRKFYELKEPKKTWIQFGDEIIDIETDERIKPTPEYFITNRIPHKLGSSKETPVIDSLLMDWMDDNKEDVIKLKEIMAYCMLSDYPINRAFALVGRGRNGKGRYLAMIEKLIGRENTTAIELHKLSTSFHAVKLYKKLCATTGETNHKIMEDTGQFKGLTGGDMINGEFKYGSGFDFNNYAKIILATNSLPPTTDKTDGFYARFMIIEFKKQYTVEKDVLKCVPKEEYNNLCTQLIPILKDLLNRGKFTNEGTIEERRKKYESMSNPLETFIEETFDKDPNSEFPKFKFNELFEAYCLNNGHRVKKYREINTLMKSEGYEDMRLKSLYSESDNPIWHWIGLKLKEK